MKRVILSCLSAVTFFACPGPTPERDAGVDAGQMVVDAGHDAGTLDAGFDAGPPCAPGDNVLGALTLRATSVLLNSSTMPDGVSQAVIIGDAVYGLKGENVIPMGTFLQLEDRPAIASINPGTPSAIFPSSFLAVNGSQLLAGFTTSAAGFPGMLTLVETTDAGVSRIAASGNFDAFGVGANGFLVSARAVGPQSDAGVYTFNNGVSSSLIGFASGSSSGNVAVTSSGMLVYGFSDATFQPHVLAAPAAQLSVPFLAATGVEVYAGSASVSDVTTVGDDVVVVQGAYDSSFNPAPPQVVLYRLTDTAGTITVAAPLPLLTSTNACTRVLFVQSNGSTLLVGLRDAAHGSRLLEIQP